MTMTDASIADIVDAQGDGKEACPECGERFVPGPGMGVHRAAKHGTHSRTGRPRKQCPECEKWFSSKDLSRHLRTVHGMGGPGPGRPPKVDITTEDIFDTVVGLLFPRGTIPVAALTPLLRWRHATDEMLIEVIHGK